MRRPRPLVLAVQGVALAAIVGGTTAFVSLDKTVTLNVDGNERRERTFAGTVGEVLADEGVRVGPRDVVAPAPGTELREGQEITVRYGRLLTLTVDGKERRVWVTARTVDEALAQLGVRADPGAFLSASRSRRIGRDGLALELRNPRAVTVVADRKARTIETTATTVRDALAQAGVTPRPQDRVSPALTAVPAAGAVIKVVRIDVKSVAGERAVDHRTVTKSTSTLYDGERRVERQGRDGVERLTYRDTFADGKRIKRDLVKREVTRRPVDEVVLVGTRNRPAETSESRSSSSSSSRSSSSSSSTAAPRGSGGLNWAGLAECESGGNPRAVNPIGYYGLYQFAPSTWRSVGGTGLPHEASPAEQTLRAQILYSRTGPSSWPVCGSRL